MWYDERVASNVSPNGRPDVGTLWWDNYEDAWMLVIAHIDEGKGDPRCIVGFVDESGFQQVTAGQAWYEFWSQLPLDHT